MAVDSLHLRNKYDYANATSREHELFYVAKGDLGLGLFAKHPIPEGTQILKLHGDPINFEQAKAYGDWECYPLQVGDNRYVDLEKPGVFANHSCDPNAGVRGDLTLVAIRPIARGEEIRYDYSTTMDEDYYEMPCRCASPLCRQSVTDFKKLPTERQAHYLRLGVVQDFIARKDNVSSTAGPAGVPALRARAL